MPSLKANQRRRGQIFAGGFSVIELLVVVAIVLILAAVSVPVVSGYTRSYSIRNTADSIAGVINLARMRASANFARAEVSCSTSTNQCTLQSKQYGGSWAADSNKQTVTLPQGVSFAIPSGITTGVGGQSSGTPYQGSQAQAVPYAMYFSSRGLPIEDVNGTAVSDYALYLTGPNNVSMAVAVDISGKPSVYFLNGSTWQLAVN